MPQLPKPPGERVRRSSSQSNGRALPAADQARPEVDERHRLLANQFGFPLATAQLVGLDQDLEQVFAQARALRDHLHPPPPPPDFDGCVRENPPPTANPGREHGQFLIPSPAPTAERRRAVAELTPGGHPR